MRRWEALWNMTEGATTFQHPSFYKVLEQQSECKLQLIWNTERTVCLPICLTPLRLGVWRRDLSFQGKYGGALGAVSDCAEWWGQCLNYIDTGLLNPWQIHPDSPVGFDFVRDETSVFSIQAGQQKGKFKRTMRKAKDAGLRVEEVQFEKVASTFEYIYRKQCQRWGIPYSGAELRRAQYSLARSSTFVVYDKHNEAIHIEAYMKSGDILINCLVAQSETGRKVGAGVALLAAHIASSEKLNNIIDMGPSGGIERVKHYKMTIGAENLVLQGIQQERLLVRIRFMLGSAKVGLLKKLRKPFRISNG